MSGGMTARRGDPRVRPAPGPPAEVGQRNGIVLVLCSALCFASLGVLAQVAHRAGVSVATLVATRFMIAAVVFWFVVAVMRRPLPGRRDALLAVALGVGYSAHTTLLFASLTETKAAIVDLLFFTYPALVAVGAVGLRRERWCGRRAAAVAATLVGTAMLLGDSAVGVNAGGAGLALAAALVYAGYILAASSLLPRIDALVFVAFLTSGAATAATAGGLVLGQLQSSFSPRDLLRTRSDRACLDGGRHLQLRRRRGPAGALPGQHRLRHSARSDSGARLPRLPRPTRSPPTRRRGTRPGNDRRPRKRFPARPPETCLLAHGGSPAGGRCPPNRRPSQRTSRPTRTRTPRPPRREAACRPSRSSSPRSTGRSSPQLRCRA